MIAVLLAAALQAGTPPAPPPATPARRVEPQGHAELLAALRAAPDPAVRIALADACVALLDRDGRDGTLEMLKVRTVRAGLRLAALDVEGAASEFDAVAAAAPRDRRDLLGAALFGLAQAHELAGHRDAARRVHERIRGELAGTRYARFAAVALNRLDSPPLAVGTRAASIGPRPDRLGRTIDLAAMPPGPVVVVFWRPGAGDTELERMLRAAAEGGLGPDRTLVVTVGTAGAGADEVATRAGWPSPPVVVPAPAGFVDDAALAYGVTRLPSTFLLGGGRVLLARDPPPARLTAALRRLLGR